MKGLTVNKYFVCYLLINLLRYPKMSTCDSIAADIKGLILEKGIGR
jgi:hypothetical protein